MADITHFYMQRKNGVVWLRGEVKTGERRTALTPTDAEKLSRLGVKIYVERSQERAFFDSDYEKAGCELVAFDSWREAPAEAWVLGLKELAESNEPLKHRHIYFGHAYKGQKGAKELLSRFNSGKGRLYDLEYLLDDAGRRVAAFGYWAGFVGAGLGVAAWCRQQIPEGEIFFETLAPYQNRSAMVNSISKLVQMTGLKPRVLVIGARGRCGRGAVEMAKSVGAQVTEWDVEETKHGGPFEEILEHNVFVNCVLLQKQIPPFITTGILKEASELGRRKLSVISDVSCDPTSPHNPVPVYEQATTLNKPIVNLFPPGPKSPALDLTAIDHLPTLLPKESSEDFSQQLLPHLIDLMKSQELPPVWKRAEDLFFSKSVSKSKKQSNEAGLSL